MINIVHWLIRVLPFPKKLIKRLPGSHRSLELLSDEPYCFERIGNLIITTKFRVCFKSHIAEGEPSNRLKFRLWIRTFCIKLLVGFKTKGIYWKQGRGSHRPADSYHCARVNSLRAYCIGSISLYLLIGFLSVPVQSSKLYVPRYSYLLFLTVVFMERGI